MAANAHPLTRVLVYALACSLTVLPISACSLRGGSTASATEQSAHADGPANIDDSASSPADEAKTRRSSRSEAPSAWVLTKTTYQEDSEGFTYKDVSTNALDDHGITTETKGETQEGNVVSSWKHLYTFDNAGNVASTTVMVEGKETLKTTCKNETDAQGRITKRVTDNSSFDTFEYDEAGNIVKLTSIISHDGSEENYYSKTVTTYDADGFVTNFTVDAGENSFTDEYVYDYGPDGLPVSCGILRNGEPVGSIELEYDDNGNVKHTSSTRDGMTVTCDFEYTYIDRPTAMVKAASNIRPVQ